MKISLFDLHADIPTKILKKERSAVSFPAVFERQIQTAAFFIPENIPDPDAYYKKMYSVFREQNTMPDNALSKSQTILFSLENGGALLSDENRLYKLKNDGITSASLTWNSDNLLAGGANGKGELSQKGSEVIKCMNRLFIATDISHLNEKSAIKAVEATDYPIASHSNCSSVFAHTRNLSDDVLSILKDKNGLVGINFYPEFLGQGNIFHNICRQIEYMLSKGLENSIAIGSDFDGADMDPDLSKTEDIITLYSYLSRYFSDKKLLDKIFFENAHSFYQKLFDKRT